MWVICVLGQGYDINKTELQCRKKLREEFMRHANVTDIRVIDLLTVKVTIMRTVDSFCCTRLC